MSQRNAHPLLASTPGNFLRLLRAYGFEARAIPRILGIAAVILARQPLTGLNALLNRRRVTAQTLDPAPLFVVGHWRSGTTHLQNLLNCDQQFGRVPLLQAALPHEYLLFSGRVRAWLDRGLPATRLMDNLPVAADAPWEEELALAASTRYCFYHVSSFPGAMERIFREAVLFEGTDPGAVDEWWAHTYRFLQQGQLTQPGKSLLLKNPANTARIRILLERVPGARFLHLHRNPYEVYDSTVHLYLRAQEAWGLHTPSRERVVAHVLDSYPRLMDAWLEQKADIPPGCLAEIRFNDLQRDPLNTLRQAYGDLGLDGFEQALPRFQAYGSEHRNYQKNRFRTSEAERNQVAERWAPYFEAFGYET